MTNLEASLGLAQMERLHTFIEKKKSLNNIYREILADIPFIKFQEEDAQGKSAWWLSSVTIEHPHKDISAIQEDLKSKGIPSRRLFVPINKFPPYKNYTSHEFPTCEYLYEYGMNLPSSTVNNEDDIIFVAEALKDICCNV